MTKTSVGASPDPQAYVYIASCLNQAGRSTKTFAASMSNMAQAFDRVRTTIHEILEQYYFDCEAEARWDDEGGAARHD